MAYTCDDILTDAKLRSFNSGTVLADTDILRLATDELLGILTAREMSAVQGHLAVESSQATVANQARYDIPYRAAGSKVRYSCLQDSQGTRSNIRPGRPERFVTTYNITTAQVGTLPMNSWFEDGRIVLYPMPTDATHSLILGIYLRPGRLVATSSAVATTAAAAVGATTISCASIPAYLNGVTSIDIIRAKPPFQVIAYDLPVTALATGGTSITVTAPGIPTYAVNSGDYITKTEESAVPQIIAEAHPLLAARTAKRILQARGDLINMQAIQQDIEELESNIFEYLSNRNEGQVDTMADNSLIASGKTRWGMGLGGF